MPQQRTSPPLTPAQQDALDALISMKVPKKEAADLIARAHGGDSGTILGHALRLRGYPGQSPRPPAGAQLKAVQGQPVAPIPAAPPQAPTPPPVPAPQQQLPGFGPPGGRQAAPTAQQLQQFLMSRQEYSPRGQAPATSGAAPNWFQRLMGAATPPPAPVAQRPAPVMQSAVQTPPASPTPAAQPPSQAPPSPSMMPAPIKPRVRVKAVGTRIPEAPTPTEAEQAKQEAAGVEETPPEKSKTQELPLVSTQQEYDKLPIGARFKHPDGFIYRKESESSESPQKLQEGGEVKPKEGGLTKIPGLTELPELEPNTDTVPTELTPGEYVMPKEAVDKVGPENLDALTARLLGQQWGAPGVPQPGISKAGRTLVEPTGQTMDTSGHPVLRGLAYGPNSEGATAADMHQLKGAWDQPLQTGDIAVSPNLQKLYPLKSHVNVVDAKGNVVLPNARVADTSMISEGRPTTDTFEIWNGPSLGKGYHLVPVGP